MQNHILQIKGVFKTLVNHQISTFNSNKCHLFENKKSYDHLHKPQNQKSNLDNAKNNINQLTIKPKIPIKIAIFPKLSFFTFLVIKPKIAVIGVRYNNKKNVLSNIKNCNEYKSLTISGTIKSKANCIERIIITLIARNNDKIPNKLCFFISKIHFIVVLNIVNLNNAFENKILSPQKKLISFEEEYKSKKSDDYLVNSSFLKKKQVQVQLWLISKENHGLYLKKVHLFQKHILFELKQLMSLLSLKLQKPTAIYFYSFLPYNSQILIILFLFNIFGGNKKTSDYLINNIQKKSRCFPIMVILFIPRAVETTIVFIITMASSSNFLNYKPTCTSKFSFINHAFISNFLGTFQEFPAILRLIFFGCSCHKQIEYYLFHINIFGGTFCR